MRESFAKQNVGPFSEAIIKPMNNETNTITRREALLCAIQGAVVASLVAAPVIASTEAPAPLPMPEFAIENDYPFFGYEPESLP